MKKLKFALLVFILLAAIPTVFFAQIRHDTNTIQEQREEMLEGKNSNAISCGENYIRVLTVTIAR
jgi:hypothetical protein